MVLAAKRDNNHDRARHANQVVPGTVGAGGDADVPIFQISKPSRKASKQISVDVPINKNAHVIETRHG
jgi:hypothetical protein